MKSFCIIVMGMFLQTCFLFSQDSIYVYKSGNIVYTRSVSDVDSITFSRDGIPTLGLLAWWPFNGNANDMSGNSHNGTVKGATLTTDRFGKTNSAYNFVKTNKDYITFDNIIGKFGTSDFTVSMWYIGTLAYGVTKWNEESFSNLWMLGGGFWICQSTDQSTMFQISPLTTITKTQWNNLIIQRQSSIYRLYVNGVLDSSYTPSTNYNITNNNPLVIGAMIAPISGPVGCMDGKIDDVGIWNRSLTTQEIKNVYNSK